MPNQFEFLKGIYAIQVPRLRVRTTKVSQVVTNYARDEQNNPIVFQQGMKMPVYRIEFSPPGWVWGVVSPPEAPQTQYACLWDKQTVFAEWILPFGDPAPPIESRVSDLERRVTRLEELIGHDEK